MQLSLFDDLFGTVEVPQVEIPLVCSAVEAPVEVETVPETESVESVPEWSLEEMLELHRYMLTDALSTLSRKDCKAEKLEIIEWIFRPDLQSGRNALDVPFSFQACCRLSGVSPDVMQDRIFSEIEVAEQMFEIWKSGPVMLTPLAHEAVEKSAGSYLALAKRRERYEAQAALRAEEEERYFAVEREKRATKIARAKGIPSEGAISDR